MATSVELEGSGGGDAGTGIEEKGYMLYAGKPAAGVRATSGNEGEPGEYGVDKKA